MDQEPNEVNTPADENLPDELRDLDPSTLAELRAAVDAFVEGKKKTESGSEAPPEEQVDDRPKGTTGAGKDVDWSEYELEFHLKHLYPLATLRQTSQGVKWVVLLDEFQSTSRNWDSHGNRLKRDNSPLNVGEYLSDMANSPEQWRPMTMLPDGYGKVGVVMHRQVPMVLPDPKPLQKTTEVEVPRDPELQKTEDAALEFMETEGLTPEVSTRDTQSEEGRERTLLVENALALNPPTESDPGPIGSRSLTDEQMKANADALREQVVKAREGEDFGEVKE